MNRNLQPGDALLVVDVQNDFCPGGAMAVPHGDEVVAVLNRWISAARDLGVPIFASRCWHPPEHVSFVERGGPWPPHCVRETPGAELHPALRLPLGTPVLSKGTDPDRDACSAFDGTELAAQLRELGVKRVWVGGLALDGCVRLTVLDGRNAGFDACLIREATRPVDPQRGDAAVAEMKEAGASIEAAVEPKV